MAMIEHFTDCSSGPSGPSVAVEQDSNARSRRVAVFFGRDISPASPQLRMGQRRRAVRNCYVRICGNVILHGDAGVMIGRTALDLPIRSLGSSYCAASDAGGAGATESAVPDPARG